MEKRYLVAEASGQEGAQIIIWDGAYRETVWKSEWLSGRPRENRRRLAAQIASDLEESNEISAEARRELRRIENKRLEDERRRMRARAVRPAR